jgi:predicted transcriptional regulator
MELGRLASEAFGNGRVDILRLLVAQPLRYTDLARRLEVSDGEVSRHLQRLAAAGLVEKQASGGFVATPLARLAMALEGPLSLLARHDEYFRTHDVASLDEPFLRRLDDLGFAEFLNDPIETQAATQRLFAGVRGHFDGICLVASHMAAGHSIGDLVSLQDACRTNGTRMRLVLQEEEARLGVQVHSALAARVEYRTVPVSRVDIAIGEGCAVAAFAQRDGRMDYNQAFFGTEARFVGFCRDYFEAVWARAKPVPARLLQEVARAPPPAALRPILERAHPHANP